MVGTSNKSVPGMAIDYGKSLNLIPPQLIYTLYIYGRIVEDLLSLYQLAELRRHQAMEAELGVGKVGKPWMKRWPGWDFMMVSWDFIGIWWDFIVIFFGFYSDFMGFNGDLMGFTGLNGGLKLIW